MSEHGPLVRILQPEEALDLIGHGLEIDEVNPLTGVPLLAVAIEDGDTLRSLARLAPDLACVLIGVGQVGGDAISDPEPLPAPCFDVLLSPRRKPPSPWVGCVDLDSALGQLASSILASPLAALSLVQLLRCTGTMTVSDALVAESWVYSMLQSGPTFSNWLARHRVTLPTSSCEEQPVVVTRTETQVEIELNRPRFHNALNMSMREALIDALRVVIADPSIETVRISGRGPSFCSGGDLVEFGTAPDPVTAHAIRIGRSVGAWLARCGDRAVMDIHGKCIGAGVELAAFAGTVRAEVSTTFSLPELEMGLIPGAGGTVSVARRIGAHRTAYLALSGCAISAPTALDWGLVDEISDRHVGSAKLVSRDSCH